MKFTNTRLETKKLQEKNIRHYSRPMRGAIPPRTKLCLSLNGGNIKISEPIENLAFSIGNTNPRTIVLLHIAFNGFIQFSENALDYVHQINTHSTMVSNLFNNVLQEHTRISVRIGLVGWSTRKHGKWQKVIGKGLNFLVVHFLLKNIAQIQYIIKKNGYTCIRKTNV